MLKLILILILYIASGTSNFIHLYYGLGHLKNSTQSYSVNETNQVQFQSNLVSLRTQSFAAVDATGLLSVYFHKIEFVLSYIVQIDYSLSIGYANDLVTNVEAYRNLLQAESEFKEKTYRYCNNYPFLATSSNKTLTTITYVLTNLTESDPKKSYYFYDYDIEIGKSCATMI